MKEGRDGHRAGIYVGSPSTMTVEVSMATVMRVQRAMGAEAQAASADRLSTLLTVSDVLPLPGTNIGTQIIPNPSRLLCRDRAQTPATASTA